MEETLETRVSPETVWQAWERAHALHGKGGGIASGGTGLSKPEKGRGIAYEIMDVVKGERFSIVWKTVFVRLVFRHAVFPKNRGAKIIYSIEIRGLLGAPIRWLLGNKIRSNIRLALKTVVQRLEAVR